MAALPVEIEQEVYKHERGACMRRLVSDITNLNKPRRVCYKTEIKNLGPSFHNTFGVKVVEDWENRPDMIHSLRIKRGDGWVAKWEQVVFEVVSNGLILDKLVYDTVHDCWVLPMFIPFLTVCMNVSPLTIILRQKDNSLLYMPVVVEYETSSMSSHEKEWLFGEDFSMNAHSGPCQSYCLGLMYYYQVGLLTSTHVRQYTCLFQPQEDLVKTFQGKLQLLHLPTVLNVYDLVVEGDMNEVSLYCGDVHVSNFEQVSDYCWKPECGNFACLASGLVGHGFLSWNIRVRPDTSQACFTAKCALPLPPTFPRRSLVIFYRPGRKRCYLLYEHESIYVYEFNNALQQGTA